MNANALACVLVMVPDPIQRGLIELSLKRKNFTPILCVEGDQARQLIIEHQPDIILLDLHFPGVNSLDLMQQLRGEGLLKNCSLIVISAMGYTEVIQRAIQAGADDFIVKPFDPDQLISRIQKKIPPKNSVTE